MVEIIRRGELPELEKHEATCARCKTEFRFEAREARLVPDPRDGDFYQIGCPICGAHVAVAAGGRRWPYDR